MLDIAIMYIDKFYSFFSSFLRARLYLTENIYISTLHLLSFNWVLMFFGWWLHDITSRRG